MKSKTLPAPPAGEETSADAVGFGTVTSDGGADGAPDRNENAEAAPEAGTGASEGVVVVGAAAITAPAPLLRKEKPEVEREAKGEGAATGGSSFFSFRSGELPAPLSSKPPNMALFRE
jgi:hypothetical protein